MSLRPRSKYVQEHRRVCHINAEQKRRCNIKNGFDTLNMLIPQINQNPNAKMSKAAMLQKGADYIIQLRSERSRLYDERQNLQNQVESLNLAIRLAFRSFRFPSGVVVVTIDIDIRLRLQ